MFQFSAVIYFSIFFLFTILPPIQDCDQTHLESDAMMQFKVHVSLINRLTLRRIAAMQ